MGETMLLDCTLRDGGYINDWNFGYNNIVSIFERIAEANVDIIEVGFLDERRSFDINRSIMPDTDSVEKIYGKLDKKNSMAVAMIDFGTCGTENIRPCSESLLDGIRVIFKKHLRRPAMEFCRELKELGYKVFVQLVSVTSYSDEELLDLISLANDIKPYAVSMVDTYGLMHCNNLMHYFELLNMHLEPEIGLGYHAHNNFQMGYANCIAMLSRNVSRRMIVDGSIYGMGKSAGNCPIELIAMHMNHVLGKNYNINQILEAIDSNISQFYSPATWGYNMFYYLAASNNCHPNYVSYLMNKKTLSVKSINEILSRLEGEDKLLYNKNYIEEKYISYQNKEINDSAAMEALKNIFSGRKLLLIGPGRTAESGHEAIEKYIREKDPCIISINFLPSHFKPDFIFISNSKRYMQLAAALSRESHHIIATSNVTCQNGDFDFNINVSPLLDLDAEIIDNSLVMFLKILIRLGCPSAVLAGFDGYSKIESNHIIGEMEYDFAKEKADYLNNYTRNFIGSVSDKIALEFLTKSRYAEESDE
ncbi:MAG: aldolase catalytic domain-containing protein [Oscillospiraceae bacterium]|nr:aldolase catalytic domain-containing protein [Oscillospiraceae bacterium]